VIRTLAIGMLLLTLPFACLSQYRSAEQGALKNMNKNRWEKAREKLEKLLAKDSLNAASDFIYAQYYFNSANPAFNIDSAYNFLNRALTHFKAADTKERERIRRARLDSTNIISLRSQIDSAAFKRAKLANTEGAFIYFLQHFPTAEQRDEAIVLRDEAAYIEAVKSNTYQGFLTFLEKYPGATRAPEAKDTYERLLYTAETRDRSLRSYEFFLQEHPATPFRRDAERHIFEISTASGNFHDFSDYLSKYPRSSSAAKAKSILFHLLKEHDALDEEAVWMTDSLRNIQLLSRTFLVPVYKNGKFGFINQAGELVIRPLYSDLNETYKCGNITEDVLMVSDGVISRDGNTIVHGKVSAVDDLGYGFIKVQVGDSCIRIIHKSGFYIGDCVKDAKIVAGKFIALKKNDHWALFTLAGRNLTRYDWEEINAVKDIIIFKKDSKFRLSIALNVAGSASDQDLKLSDPFDEIKPWPMDRLWVRTAAFQGILNQQLQAVIPFDQYQLTPVFFGALGRTVAGTRLFSVEGTQIGAFKNVRFHEPWIFAQLDSTWRLFKPGHGLVATRYDSIAFEGPFALGFSRDSLTVHFPEGEPVKFAGRAFVNFIPGMDSTSFLVIQEDRKKNLLDHRGVRKFQIEYDNIQYGGGGLFIVSKKDKKGLVDSNGKILLPVEFDAIGTASGDLISLLRNKRFGAYMVSTGKLIKPGYEKNISVYNDKMLFAYLKGFYGFMDWEGKPLGAFDFNEIRYWNDSTALVRKNFNWFIYDIKEKKFLEENIKNVAMIRDLDEDKLAIVKQENSFGVMSNKDGFIIPATFSKVFNLGSSEQPLFFTEKHVEEADIYVVIYYDYAGRLLYRQVYEEEDAYSKILCSDN
jgi:sporulation protein YlmC with PRC-barrel domain